MSEHEQGFRNMLRDIVDGSPEGAAQFLAKYGKYLLKVIRRRLHKKLRMKFDSEDFLQDVYASFFHDPPPPETFATPEAFFGFLATLARNKVAAVDRQRRQHQQYNVDREISLDDSTRALVRHLTGKDPTPSEVAAADEKWNRMLAGDRRREVMIRMLREGYTHEEIASYLETNAKHVQRVLERMRKRFIS